MLAQQGYTINLPDLIKMVWRSGIGVRGLDNIVVTLGEMQQILQKQQQMSGMPIGPQTQPTNLPPDVQQLLDQVKGAAPQGAQSPQQGGNNTSIPALNPTLPNASNGFVRR
jgi:flavorubredoxin